MHPAEKSVDVLINVFSKPYQTALALLSLLRRSGQYIDTIYFHQEPCTSEFEKRGHERLLARLGDQVRLFMPKYWLGRDATEEQRLTQDAEYRLSMRYQYGWEQTDKQYVLIMHNDLEVIADPVTALMGVIGDATAAGEIGQCWWCPAGQQELCSSERYTEFRPKYHQLMYIYNQSMDYQNRRAYNLGLRQEYWTQPWPLPECRVNEWCMLVDMHKARSATLPFGTAAPIGCRFVSGSKIGEKWDEDVCLDTSVQWFRDMCLQGHSFAHYPVERCIVHDRKGAVALHSPEVYVKNEIRAKERLAQDYPEYFQ